MKRGMIKLQAVMSKNPMLDTDHTLESELVQMINGCKNGAGVKAMRPRDIKAFHKQLD